MLVTFQRVLLFRKNVLKEKDALGLTESACTSPQSTLITVHRSRIVEVGYKSLFPLASCLPPPLSLKRAIISH